MATNTYVALDKVTVTTATPSITFTGINQGYTDLVLIATPIFTTSANVNLRINGDTGSNYSDTYLYANGSTATSARDSNSNILYWSGTSVGVTTANRDNGIAHFMNYSNTTTNKTVLLRYNQAEQILSQGVGLYRSTSAITSISVIASAGNLDTGSTFSLYGIAASSVGAKATGGDIYADSQYFYHVFDATGTFTPSQALSCDVMVTAGGGGGGSGQGGGGGAGGFRVLTSQSLGSGTAYTATIGGGGAGGTSDGKGTSGSTSSFAGSGLTTINTSGGGGGGGYGVNRPAISGGSGGGAGSSSTGVFAGASGNSGGYSPSEGNNGGSSSTDDATYRNGGGGGGAGAVGGNGLTVSPYTGGAGGAGSSTYSSWGVATGIGQEVSGTYFIAGGGAGNSGAVGGSGGGGNSTVSAKANTGSGGGGGSGSTTGAGGSGVVIVRYLKA
jgi:hypothetical protein